jgi:hypothetical protein
LFIFTTTLVVEPTVPASALGNIFSTSVVEAPISISCAPEETTRSTSAPLFVAAKLASAVPDSSRLGSTFTCISVTHAGAPPSQYAIAAEVAEALTTSPEVSAIKSPASITVADAFKNVFVLLTPPELCTLKSMGCYIYKLKVFIMSETSDEDFIHILFFTDALTDAFSSSLDIQSDSPHIRLDVLDLSIKD